MDKIQDPWLLKELELIEKISADDLIKVFEHKKRKYKRIPLIMGRKDPFKTEIPCPHCCTENELT